MEPNKSLLGVVIRKDGTVPFDCSPDVRAQTLAWLAENHPNHEVHKNHAKIANWTPPNS